MANKHFAKKCTYDGYKFDSLKEGRVYNQLKLMKTSKCIKYLTPHPRYDIVFYGKKVCTAILDFEYYDIKERKKHYIDVKAFDKKKKKFLITPLSRLKKKLIEAQYKIKVDYV